MLSRNEIQIYCSVSYPDPHFLFGGGSGYETNCSVYNGLITQRCPPLSFPSRMPYWSPDQTRMLTTCMAAWIDNKCQSYVFDCINWGAICECLLQAGFIPAAYLECQIYTASISLILNPLPTVTRGCNVTKKNIIMSGMVQRTCCIFCTISPIVKV